MYPKAKYHLYEKVHSGMIPDETVNLVPRTWTKRTVTDGEWMTNRTIDVLDRRDYYLANVLDEVDKDKAEHYIGKRGIVVDNENRMIYFSYVNDEYIFDNNSALSSLDDSYYVYTNIPSAVDGVENKLYINESGYIDYYVNPIEIPVTSYEEPTTTSSRNGFSGGDYTSTPSGSNVIFVTQSTFYEDISTVDGGIWYDKESGCQWNWETSAKDTWPASTGIAPEPTAYPNTSTSSVIFDPTDRTTAHDVTGGKNFISGNIDMVPSGILFVY